MKPLMLQLKEFMVVTCLLAVCLIPETQCKPANTETEVIHNKNQSPCHVADAKAAVKTEYDFTTEKLTSLAQRTFDVIFKINEVKRKITNGGDIIKKCVTSKFSQLNLSRPCKSIKDISTQQMAECIVSSYMTIKQFTESLKTLENEYFTSESKKNFKDISKPISELDIYTDQLLCEMYIDLKQFGYKISAHQSSHGNNVSILSNYTEQAKTIDNNDCFHIGYELNEIQILHIIYQFLDTYYDVMQDVKELFVSENYADNVKSDIQQSSPVTGTVTSSSTLTTSVQDLIRIIAG